MACGRRRRTTRPRREHVVEGPLLLRARRSSKLGGGRTLLQPRLALVLPLQMLEQALQVALRRGVSALGRLRQAWFARYFADGWRAWLQEKGLPLGDNFISTNQYACIKLNAESLLLFYHWLCAHPQLRKAVPVSVCGFGSQQNEKL